MTDQKFNGILKEVIENCPDMDIADFLQDELRLPLFKAEALAKRIEKEVLNKRSECQKELQYILEKSNDTNISTEKEYYCVDSLSNSEFEYFMNWLFVQLGYEIQPEKIKVNSGIDIVTLKAGERVLIQARKHPKTHMVTDYIIKTSIETQHNYNCNRTILVITSFFNETTIAKAQKVGVELWDRNTLTRKIIEAKQLVELEEVSLLPKFRGSLLQSLLELGKTKDFIIEEKAAKKYDLYLSGIKYPLLTFQSQNNRVIYCVCRIKYNQPISEVDGEVLVNINDAQVRFVDENSYELISKYLEQFLE